MNHWSAKLETLHACSDAIEWARKQPSLAVAWAACERGDWMLWLIGRLDASPPWSDERKPLVRCTVESTVDIEEMAISDDEWRIDVVKTPFTTVPDSDIGGAVVKGEFMNYDTDYLGGVAAGRIDPIDPEDKV